MNQTSHRAGPRAGHDRLRGPAPQLAIPDELVTLGHTPVPGSHHDQPRTPATARPPHMVGLLSARGGGASSDAPAGTRVHHLSFPRTRVPAPGRPCGSARSDSRTAGKYSTEVPQQGWIQADVAGRWGTVTCGDGRGWMWCLLFASRGSGVRVPLAPQVRRRIRTGGLRVQQKSTATGIALDAVHAFEWGFALVGGCGLWRTDLRVWAGIRAAEQEGRHRPDPAPPAWRVAGSVLDLPFQGWCLPLLQRVSEWQAISVTHGHVSCDSL